MGAFGSCLGVGRPVKPNTNPRLIGSNLVNVDTNPFVLNPNPNQPHHPNGRNSHQNHQMLRPNHHHPSSGAGHHSHGHHHHSQQQNGPPPPSSYLMGANQNCPPSKGLPAKLFRQSSGLSSVLGGRQSSNHGGAAGALSGSGQNVITKLVDIDDNPLDRSNIINNGNNNNHNSPPNSQLICNSTSGKQVNNSQINNNNKIPQILANVQAGTVDITKAFVDALNVNPNDVRDLVAIYDYKSQTDEDLPLSKGEHLETIEAFMDQEWWLARSKSTGKIGYIPMNYVAILKSKAHLHSEPWYFGRIGREQAEFGLKLPGNEDGAFIIRDSESKIHKYSLTILFEGVKHYRIRLFEKGGYYINITQVFSTIQDLVEAHSIDARGLCTKLGKPCKRWPLDLMLSSYNGSNHDAFDIWEIDRNMLTVGQELGRGQFGQVFEGVFNNNGKHVRVAIKTLRKGSMDPKDFLAEAQIMKKMRHENLVQLYAVCTREEPVYIITELMSKGALINYLQTDTGKSLPFAEYVNMATQIANGMSYIEKEKYVHRDLAARNILVGEQNVCKIADFGLARFIKETEYEARAGARFPIKWTAPEAANFSKFTIKSDVWSFGIVLYEIITKGGTPYPDMSNAEVLSRIDKGYRMPRPPDCDAKYYEIMLKCWNKDPNNRPTFEALHWRLGEFFLPDEQYREATEFRIK